MTKTATINKALAAAMGTEPDVAPPASKARSGSLTSAIADLQLGSDPVAKVYMVEPDVKAQDLRAVLSTEKERMRNNVTSCVVAARKRVPGADYSIEVGEILMGSGVYVVALISRKV